MTRLCALAQFDLDHLDLRISGQRGKFLRRKLAFVITTAKIAGCNLKDQIAGALSMVSADAALPRVMSEATLPSPCVERKDSVGGE